MNHELLFEQAKEAIDELFSDTSVPQATTKESLERLRGFIDMCIQAIEGNQRLIHHLTTFHDEHSLKK